MSFNHLECFSFSWFVGVCVLPQKTILINCAIINQHLQGYPFPLFENFP